MKKIISSLKITNLYLPVTLIRMMKSLSALSFKVHKKNNLETLGSMENPCLQMLQNGSIKVLETIFQLLTHIFKQKQGYYMFTNIQR